MEIKTFKTAITAHAYWCLSSLSRLGRSGVTVGTLVQTATGLLLISTDCLVLLSLAMVLRQDSTCERIHSRVPTDLVEDVLM